MIWDIRNVLLWEVKHFDLPKCMTEAKLKNKYGLNCDTRTIEHVAICGPSHMFKTLEVDSQCTCINGAYSCLILVAFTFDCHIRPFFIPGGIWSEMPKK